MMLGMSLATFTLVHVVISLVAIFAGAVVVYGWVTRRRLDTWTAIFLSTTIATSITGFMFPPKPIGPPHIFGFISLALLTLALIALYYRGLAGHWRWIYIASALVSLYLNVVVLVVQSFQKISFLNALAPTGNELPVAMTQGAVFATFVVLGILATKRFRPIASAAVFG